MSTRPDNDEPLLGRFEPPKLPSHLRSAVLASARAALRQSPVTDPWTALFLNTRLRTAWVAAMVLLALGHLALSVRRAPEAELRTFPLALSVHTLAGEVAAEGELPRIDPLARSLGAAILDAQPRLDSPPRSETLVSSSKERPS